MMAVQCEEDEHGSREVRRVVRGDQGVRGARRGRVATDEISSTGRYFVLPGRWRIPGYGSLH